MPRTRAMGRSPGGFVALDMDAPTRKRKAAQPRSSEHEAKKIRTTGAPEYLSASLRSQRQTLSSPSLAQRITADATNDERSISALSEDESHPFLAERESADGAGEQLPVLTLPYEHLSPPTRKSADAAGERHPIFTLSDQHPSPSKRKSVEAASEQRRAPALPEEHYSSPRRQGAGAAGEQRPENQTQVERVQTEISADKSEGLSDITPTSPPTTFSNLSPRPESWLLGDIQASIGGGKRPLTKIELEAKKRSQRSFRNLARLARPRRPEDDEALSDCEDDDDWNRRYKQMLSDLNLSIPDTERSPPTSPTIEWAPESKVMFVLKNNDKRGSPCREYLPFNTPSISPSISRSVELKIRKLTEESVIVAISASLNWFEKNPDSAVPTAAEMSSLLEDFNRSKRLAVTSEQSRAHVDRVDELSYPVTPRAQQARDGTPEPTTPSSTSSSSPESSTSSPSPLSQNGSPEPEQPVSQTLAPQTPPPKAEEPRSWAVALSASAANLWRTPLSLFRGGRDRQVQPEQNAPNTDTRPAAVPSLGLLSQSARPQRCNPQSARPQRRGPQSARPQRRDPFQSTRPQRHDGPFTPSFRPTRQVSSARTSRELHATNASKMSSQAPAPMSTWKGGRRDSHLPIHLRGVQYKDLPREWQVVSEHMKPTKEEEEEEEERLRILSHEAEMDRAAQREKERQEREFREHNLRHAQVGKKSESETGKKRATKPKPPPTPTYPNTFCAPEYSDTDSDSSEEELEDVIMTSPEATNEKREEDRGWIPGYVEPEEEITDEMGRDEEGGPLWIPRGYKALDTDGRCKAGTEFDLPAWVSIDSAEEVDRLAMAYNRRVISYLTEHSPSSYVRDPRFVPVVRARIPKSVPQWASKVEISRRLAIQQEYEMLHHRFEEIDSESMRMVARKWKRVRATHIVEQREKWARIEEAKAAEAKASETKAAEVKASETKATEAKASETKAAATLAAENINVGKKPATDIAEASIPLQESAGGRVNQSIQKARADAEKYKPKIPSGLRVGKIMSPINDKNVKAYMSLDVIQDTDVINTVMNIPDENIIPELFLLESPKPPKPLLGFDHPSFEEEVEKAFADVLG